MEKDLLPIQSCTHLVNEFQLDTEWTVCRPRLPVLSVCARLFCVHLVLKLSSEFQFVANDDSHEFWCLCWLCQQLGH